MQACERRRLGQLRDAYHLLNNDVCMYFHTLVTAGLVHGDYDISNLIFNDRVKDIHSIVTVPLVYYCALLFRVSLLLLTVVVHGQFLSADCAIAQSVG